jgi:hypothetical protein
VIILKVYKIEGRITNDDDITDEEFLDKLYFVLKSAGMFFQGETKDITEITIHKE